MLSRWWSRTPKVLVFAGLLAMAFAVFAGRPAISTATIAAASTDFYPGPCTKAPTNVVIHYRGGVSGCTDTNNVACQAGEVIEFTASSSNYAFAVCDTFTWAFGDGTTATTLWPSITRQFTGNSVRTVRLSVANSFATGGVKGTTVDVPPSVGTSCVAGSNTLCYVSNRYMVTVDAADNPTRSNKTSLGSATVKTADTGFFTLPSLADASDIQVVVKVLDLGGKPLMFYGALTDTEVFINVIDTQTKAVYRLHKDPGVTNGGFALGDSGQLPVESCASAGTPSSTTTEAPSTCSPSATVLCLNNNRFRVSIQPTDPNTKQPVTGNSVAHNDTFGFFNFSVITGNANNLEAFAKVVGPLPGIGYINFYGGLTSFEYRIKFTDTVKGTSKTYLKRGTPTTSDANASACGGFDTFAQ